MKRFCPRCYAKKFATVEIQEAENSTWVCIRDPSHVFTIDKEGYPRSKKID